MLLPVPEPRHDRLQVLRHGALFGRGPGAVAGDHRGRLPTTGKHDFLERCAAGGELARQPDTSRLALMVGSEASGAVKVPVVDRYVTVLIRGPLVLRVSRSLPPALLRCPRSCPFAPVLSSARAAPVSCLFPREVDFTFSRLFSLRRLRGSGQRGARALGRAADEGPAGPSSVVSRSLPCALRPVPEPRHGSAGGGLAARIPRRHRRRLPPVLGMADSRQRRLDARKTVTDFAKGDDPIVELEPVRGGWRVYGPKKR